MRRTASGVTGVLMAAALVSGGCLTVERRSLEVRLESDQVGSYRVEFYNIQSAAETAGGQQADFEQLLAMAGGDEYLLQAAEGGRYVRTRELTVERGVVVGRESGLFRFTDRAEFPPLQRRADGGIRLPLDPDDEYVGSDGVWLPESSEVRWPAGTREMKLTLLQRDFKPAAGFAARLEKKRKP